jgi:hypothetical protein
MDGWVLGGEQPRCAEHGPPVTSLTRYLASGLLHVANATLSSSLSRERITDYKLLSLT